MYLVDGFIEIIINPTHFLFFSEFNHLYVNEKQHHPRQKLIHMVFNYLPYAALNWVLLMIFIHNIIAVNSKYATSSNNHVPVKSARG